jgi:hypothetical protein
MSPRWGLDTKTDWPTDRQSQYDFDYVTVLRRQLEGWEVGVRWLPACEDVIPGAEERPLLEDVTKQRNEHRGWEH